MRESPLALTVVTLLAAAACAGDDGESGGSTTASRRPLVELTVGDAAELCEPMRAVRVSAADYRRGLCVFQASAPPAFSDDPLAACQTALDECVASGPTDDMCEPMVFSAGCSATVAEYLECDAMAIHAFEAFAARTCAQVVGRTEELSAELAAVLADCNQKLDGCSPSNDACCATLDDTCGYTNDTDCECPDADWDAADCEI